MVQIIQRQPTAIEQFSEAFGPVAQSLGAMAGQRAGRLRQEEQTQQENEKLKKMGLDLSGIKDPKLRQIALAEKLKGQTEKEKFSEKLKQDQAALRKLEKDRGLEEGALEGYDLSMAERVSRPEKQPRKTQASQPIDPEQLKIIKDTRNKPGFDELDELGQYRAFIDAGVSKENAAEESKLRGAQLTRQGQQFDKSYEAQKDFIDETTQAYKGFETEMKPRLLQMQHLKPEDIISPTAATFLETLGIPLGALENPSSELFNKLSQDLLKGLPDTYGNRILKVEVENFLKTIPTLLNSPNGRRMIASNMLKLGEMKEIYYNAMRDKQREYLDSGTPFPKDFQQTIFDQVKPQIDRLNDEFVKMSEITSIPEGTVPFFGPDGEIKFVPEEHIDWAIKNKGKRIW